MRRAPDLPRCLRTTSNYLFASLAGLLTLSSARAEFVFKEVSHHAGVVFSGNRLQHSFTFVNEGPETATIIEARASCGCMVPRLTQKSFKPGEAGKLELEINTLSQATGPLTWTVHLRYQVRGQTLETLLQLHAQLRTEVRVQPASLVLLVDRAPAHELTITDLRATHLNITKVLASSPSVKLQLAEPTRNEAGQWQRKISLQVADDFPKGRHEELVQIYTDDAKYPELRVPLTVVKRAQERVTATPSEVTLTGTAGQPLPSRIVLLRDNANEPVAVEHIMTDDPAITCHWASGPGALATLKVQIDRHLLANGSLESAVHVQLSKPVAQTISIPVKCFVK